jgi:hypothetical protein
MPKGELEPPCPRERQVLNLIRVIFCAVIPLSFFFFSTRVIPYKHESNRYDLIKTHLAIAKTENSPS